MANREWRRLPVAAADGCEEAFFLEILFEHVERFSEQVDPGIADRRIREHLRRQRGVAQGDGADRQCNRRTHGIACWCPLLDQFDERVLVPGHGKHAQRGG
jgi:hypothetical protein